MTATIIVVLIAAAFGLFFFAGRAAQYERMCECAEGFKPNPLDNRCLVCREFMGIDSIMPAPVEGTNHVEWVGAECDFNCGSKTYTTANPFVKICQQRPSDHADMCCVMWGHADCAGAPVGTLPSISESGGVATPDQWSDWIESSEARKMGFVFLT